METRVPSSIHRTRVYLLLELRENVRSIVVVTAEKMTGDTSHFRRSHTQTSKGSPFSNLTLWSCLLIDWFVSRVKGWRSWTGDETFPTQSLETSRGVGILILVCEDDCREAVIFSLLINIIADPWVSIIFWEGRGADPLNLQSPFLASLAPQLSDCKDELRGLVLSSAPWGGKKASVVSITSISWSSVFYSFSLITSATAPFVIPPPTNTPPSLPMSTSTTSTAQTSVVWAG